MSGAPEIGGAGNLGGQGAAGTPVAPETPPNNASGAPILTPPNPGEGQSQPPAQTPASKWPENWRDEVAAGDPDVRKLAERYTSPTEVAKALKAAQAKISSGQLVSKLPDNPSPQELATWRAENGIPESPDKYVPQLPNGVVLGEDDAPLVKGFQEAALNANLNPKQFNDVMNWYVQEGQKQQEVLAQADEQFHQQAEDDLRKEWGPDEYRRNVNSIQNLMAAAPQGVAERLFGGRTADGRLIGDDPQVVRFLAQLAKELNPAASLLPPGTTNTTQGLSTRISQIEATLKDEPRKYWSDAAMQQEYRDLLSARDKLANRG